MFHHHELFPHAARQAIAHYCVAVIVAVAVILMAWISA